MAEEFDAEGFAKLMAGHSQFMEEQRIENLKHGRMQILEALDLIREKIAAAQSVSYVAAHRVAGEEMPELVWARELGSMLSQQLRNQIRLYMIDLALQGVPAKYAPLDAEAFAGLVNERQWFIHDVLGLDPPEPHMLKIDPDEKEG